MLPPLAATALVATDGMNAGVWLFLSRTNDNDINTTASFSNLPAVAAAPGHVVDVDHGGGEQGGGSGCAWFCQQLSRPSVASMMMLLLLFLPHFRF